MSASDLEDHLLLLLRAHGLPEPVREYRFAKAQGRRWRFDLCWPAQKVAVEVEGAVYVNGRHTRGSGFTADVEKHNAATLAGYRLIRCTREHIASGQAVDWITQALNGRDAA